MNRLGWETGRLRDEAEMGEEESGWRGGRYGRYREEIDTLRMRVDLLGGTDRVLMKLYLDGGGKVSDMARLMGLSESTVARRIRRIKERLMDGRYIECFKRREELGKVNMGIARDLLVGGLRQKEIAEKRGLSAYQVRKGIEAIRGVLGEAGNAQQVTVGGRNDTKVFDG
jgi:transposase